MPRWEVILIRRTDAPADWPLDRITLIVRAPLDGGESAEARATDVLDEIRIGLGFPGAASMDIDTCFVLDQGGTAFPGAH